MVSGWVHTHQAEAGAINLPVQLRSFGQKLVPLGLKYRNQAQRAIAPTAKPTLPAKVLPCLCLASMPFQDRAQVKAVVHSGAEVCYLFSSLQE
jgi:hypothetical protein